MSDGYAKQAVKALATIEGTAADAARFAAELSRRAGGDSRALDELNVPDLALAWASLEGDEAALRELDRRLRACGSKFDDEILQLARHLLLVGPKAKLRGYSGKGALVKWLRTVLLSVSVDARRKAGPERDESDEELAVRASGEAGADVRLMSARHRAEFTRAFGEALKDLEARERAVLRMRYVDQVSLEVAARSLGTHRTTAARWMDAAFQKVLAGTRRRLNERLELETGELDSLWRMFEPSLAERLSRLLPPSR